MQPDRVVLIEDPLFFGDRQYPMRFHKQKLWLHRASMTRFAERLREEGEQVDYIAYEAGRPVTQETVTRLSGEGVTQPHLRRSGRFYSGKAASRLCRS